MTKAEQKLEKSYHSLEKAVNRFFNDYQIIAIKHLRELIEKAELPYSYDMEIVRRRVQEIISEGYIENDKLIAQITKRLGPGYSEEVTIVVNYISGLGSIRPVLKKEIIERIGRRKTSELLGRVELSYKRDYLKRLDALKDLLR